MSARPTFRMNHERLIVIGDIHGCVHALDGLLAEVKPQPADTLVCLGDFIDQGRDSCQVMDTLIKLETQCRLVTILGNHEEMLLEALTGEEARQAWLMAGGVNTLNSYFFGAGLDVIPPDHVQFLRDCLDYYETDAHIFTHAGYVPHLKMADQPDYALRWQLLEEPFPRPHCSGKTVVVGHTEQNDDEPLDLGYLVCLDTACWRGGWLTAMEVHTRQTWQVSRWGVPRSDFRYVR